VGADDALRVHLLLRSPTPEELTHVRAVAERITLRLTPEGRRGPAAAGWDSSATPKAAAFSAGFAPAVMLSGEASGFRELLGRLAEGPALARELGRAFERTLFPQSRPWRLRTRTLALERPLVMGIVNVTPDSFSDGGRFLDPGAAVRHGRHLAAAGADLLDVGGESTRPGAERVEAEEEMRRAIPVVAGLAGLDLPVSIDTTRAAVARAALAAGAEIVNDVSALRFDPELAEAAAEAGAGLVLMHMLGTPRTMQQEPAYQDVAGEVLEFLGEALERAERSGVDPARCAIDPGIGFGKRLQDNEELLYRLEELSALGRPLVVGPSRKSLLDPRKLRSPEERLPETLAAACLAALGGARILRVHDADECRRALEVVRRIQGWPGEE
jgi:dihydropteroate synthase